MCSNSTNIIIDLDKRDKLKLFGTEGSGHQKKCWIKENGHQYLIKINSKFKEATKEHSASVILRSCGINAVYYDVIDINYKGQKRIACMCKSFLSAGESTTTLSSIMEDVVVLRNESAASYFDKAVNSIVDTLKIPKQIVYNRLITILTCDFLVMNRDRHLSNIESICGVDGKWRLAPLFDFGQSFLSRDGIQSNSEFENQRRKFKSLQFSTNPKRNLIDVDLSKSIANKMSENICGIQGIDKLNINTFHKRVFTAQMRELLSY